MNFARNVLVEEEAIVDALVSGHVKHYVTDFPTPQIVGVKGAIVIPHLGASTEESEDNCAVMAASQIKNYLENGNIKIPSIIRTVIWDFAEIIQEFCFFITTYRI